MITVQLNLGEINYFPKDNKYEQLPGVFRVHTGMAQCRKRMINLYKHFFFFFLITISSIPFPDQFRTDLVLNRFQIIEKVTTIQSNWRFTADNVIGKVGQENISLTIKKTTTVQHHAFILVFGSVWVGLVWGLLALVCNVEKQVR